MTDDASKATTWDHSSDQHFVDYYAQQSLSPETAQRFTLVRDKIASTADENSNGGDIPELNVADIGCGRGNAGAAMGRARSTRCSAWTSMRHSSRLPANERKTPDLPSSSMSVRPPNFPTPMRSMDVALLPELLETRRRLARLPRRGDPDPEAGWICFT